MKKLNKTIAALTAALLLMLSLASCSSSGATGATVANTEYYITNSVYAEAGYEGDCYNGVASILYLYDDGSYILTENTSVIQSSYAVVTNWTYNVTGTYTVDSESDGVKTVTLSAATSGDYTMNGSITTSADDSSILADYGEQTVTCDSSTHVLTKE